MLIKPMNKKLQIQKRNFIIKGKLFSQNYKILLTKIYLVIIAKFYSHAHIEGVLKLLKWFTFYIYHDFSRITKYPSNFNAFNQNLHQKSSFIKRILLDQN